MKTFLSSLSSFWDPHPALFIALSLLLGTTCALAFHFVIPCILIVLALTKGSWKFFVIAILCALLAYGYAWYRLPTRSLPQEKISGVGVFHVDQIKLSSSFFNRSFLYQGKLLSFIPKTAKESDLGLSQSPGDKRSHLACITYTGDDAIDSSAGAFASVRNRFFSCFRYTSQSGAIYQNLPCQIYLPAKSSHPPAHCDYQITGTLCQKGDYRFVFKPEKKKEWIPIPSSFSLAESRFLGKQALFSHLKKYIPNAQSRNLLYALISGDVDEKLLTLSFGKVGLQHLLAVSGFHFTLIGGFLGLIFRLFLPYRTSLIALIALLSLYALFVGGSCAIARAYLAFFFIHIGKLTHLRMSGLNALGLALIFCILQTPLNLLDLGFQFSFLCTLSLLLAYPLVHVACQTLFPQRTYADCLHLSLVDQHGYLACQWIRSTLSLNLSVHLFSLPLILMLFHKFPLLSIVYNLFFPLCLAFSLLLLILGLTLFPLIPALGGLIHSWNNAWTSTILFFTSEPPAALDFSLRTNTLSLATTVLWIACLFFTFQYFSLKKKICR